ncbi:MAG: FAD-dependent monooxygenase [Xanthobacteraceae bacterium]|nr:FAD-dependent monooxygenase [Xanthobacteraceae bacterium]
MHQECVATESWIRPASIGAQAVVVGAGIAGIAAARVLADWFETVILLERDFLHDAPTYRTGTPQARHPHVLLLGGQRALQELFPALDSDFIAAGSVPLQVNRDLREELPDGRRIPQRDLGLTCFALTRPRLEYMLRQRLAQQPNIIIQDGTRVVDLLAEPNGRRIKAIRCEGVTDNRSHILPADLVVDASGRGQLTVGYLMATGRPFQQTEINIDIGYSTAVLDVPEDVSRDWKAVITHNKAPYLSRRAVILPIEGNRWLMTALGYRDDHPPADWSAILSFLQHLTTRTIYDAVSKLRPKDRVARFGLPASVWRHFEGVADFPDNLLPIGDAICRFNPAYGQGMSVAAKEAALLRRVLATHAPAPDPFSGLSRAFLREVGSFIETPWTMAALPDLAFPEVRGERPADLNRSLAFQHALMRLAGHDEEVQRLRTEVWHMLKPPSVLRAPEIARRVEAEMAETVYA